MLYLLARSFAFGGIKHPELTPVLRWAPIAAGMLITLIYWLLPVKPPLAGDGSLSREMLNVFAILPGFYIAALSAVATFNRIEMDFIMPNPAPQLKLRTGQTDSWTELTFRLFISHLFAYLTTLSFIAAFLFVGADLLSASISHGISAIANTDVKELLAGLVNCSYVALVGWISTKIVLTTLIGMYFLAERIQRPAS